MYEEPYSSKIWLGFWKLILKTLQLYLKGLLSLMN